MTTKPQPSVPVRINRAIIELCEKELVDVAYRRMASGTYAGRTMPSVRDIIEHCILQGLEKGKKL